MKPSENATPARATPSGLLGGVSWKIVSQLLGFLLTVLTAGIVPRHLGAFAYGLYALSLFLPGQVIQLLECRIRTHFVARVAHGENPADPAVVGIFFGAVGTVVGIGFVALLNSPFASLVFGDIHPIAPGMLATLAVVAILSWWQEFLGGILDGLGKTAILEGFRIVQRSLFTLMILFLAWSDGLSLGSLARGSLLVHGASTIGFALFAWRALGTEGATRWHPVGALARSVRYYVGYAKPMLGYLLLGILADVAGRLVLQSRGGSVQQGHFAFASALAVGAGIAYSAAVPLIIREMGKVAQEPQDLLPSIYRYQPILLAVTMIPMGFILPFMDCIVHLLAGSRFDQAILPARLQMVRPITDSMFGMIACAVYAAGKGGIFFRISLIVEPLGIVVLLLFMEWFEPSVALSLKMVVGDVLAGLVGTMFLVSWLRPEPARLLRNAIPPFLFLGVGVFLRFAMDWIGSGRVWTTLLAGGVLYLGLSAGTAYLLPRAIGFRSRKEALGAISRGRPIVEATSLGGPK